MGRHHSLLAEGACIFLLVIALVSISGHVCDVLELLHVLFVVFSHLIILSIVCLELLHHMVEVLVLFLRELEVHDIFDVLQRLVRSKTTPSFIGAILDLVVDVLLRR